MNLLLKGTNLNDIKQRSLAGEACGVAIRHKCV